MAPHSTESSDWQVNYPEIKLRSAHLWRSKYWTDCTFRFENPEMDVGDEAQGAEATVEAHRLILAMASPVFAAMFYGNVGDKEEPVLISDIDLEIFKKMMVYIYSDEVDITNAEVAINLFRAANKYLLVHLEKKCIDYLFDKLNTNNVCHVYEFSCLYNKDELKQKCLEMFSINTRDVLKGCSFNNAQVETLKTIYSMDSLNIDSELELLHALVLYTEAQFQEIQKETNVLKMDENETNLDTMDLNRNNCSSDEGKAVAEKRVIASRKIIPGLIENIRFLTITADEFASCRYLSKLLTETEIMSLLMNMCSRITPVAMPDSFSTSVIQRAQNSRSHQSGYSPIRITVNNISKLKKYKSKIFFVRNIPWFVVAKPSYGYIKYLQVKIVCLMDVKLTWTLSLQTGVQFIPVSPNVATQPLEMESCLITEKWNNVRHSYSWNRTVKPAYGLVRNNSLTMDIYILPNELLVTNTKKGVQNKEQYELDNN